MGRWRKQDVKFRFYVGPGESRQLNGIYAACMDFHKSIPNLFDFPHIENPNRSNGKSGSLVPQELYLSNVSPRTILTVPGSAVNLSTEFFAPDVAGAENISTAGSWTLTKPEGSAAVLSSIEGNATSFFADLRGSYQASNLLHVNNAPGQSAAFTIHSTGGTVVAADDMTETFESGSLTGGAFVWETSGDKPAEFQLLQNTPNPFNPTTTIIYSVPRTEHVKLRVYDVMGREVAVLVDEVKQRGQHRVTFDGRDLTSGIYFYQLQAGTFSQLRRLALVK